MKRYGQAWFWLLLLLAAGPATAGLFDRFGDAGQQKILDADQAFQIIVNPVDPLTLEARWTIAPGYYLYRDKFRLSLVDAPASASPTSRFRPAKRRMIPTLARSRCFIRQR